MMPQINKPIIPITGRLTLEYQSPEYRLLKQVEHLIEARFREQLHLNYYAKAAGMGLSQLNRVLLKHKGKTLSALLDERLLAEAKVQLQHTCQPAKVISYELGFSDPSYFYRYFKRKTGMTVMEFRKHPNRMYE